MPLDPTLRQEILELIQTEVRTQLSRSQPDIKSSMGRTHNLLNVLIFFMQNPTQEWPVGEIIQRLNIKQTNLSTFLHRLVIMAYILRCSTGVYKLHPDLIPPVPQQEESSCSKPNILTMR